MKAELVTNTEEPTTIIESLRVNERHPDQSNTDLGRLRSLLEHFNDTEIQAVEDIIPNQPLSNRDSDRQVVIAEVKPEIEEQY